MKMRLPTFLLTNVLAVAVNAQVATERPVVLTGAAPEDRQLTGLNIATTTDAVLTAEVERTGSFRLATPAMGNTWTIDLDATGEIAAPFLQLCLRKRRLPSAAQ